jgi:hypothetical protein
MTQLAHNPAFLQIEDRLDEIGQKYRGQRIVRGIILWLAGAVVATFAAGLAAHLIGDASTGNSRWTWVVIGIWAMSIVATAVIWVIRPLMIRPTAVEVARLLEQRVEGLHNGLTNSVLLAEATDLHESPWLPQIFDEIRQTMSNRPISDAVKMADLGPVLMRSTLVALPLLLVMVIFSRSFGHGFQQMFHPAAFVPQVGTMKIVSVQPGDVTLVADQPLEISATASGPQTPDATLLFDDGTAPATLAPSPADDNTLRYSYRVEHVSKSLKYRLEVGGTQSQWYAATVVRQIKLQTIAFKITPPAYTRVAASVITLKPEQIDNTPVTVPQGSAVELSAAVDVPANGAMLQLGDASPSPMTANIEKTSFSGSMTITDDTPVGVLLTDGAGQIVAKLPEQPLIIHCTKDAAPTIEMKWPTQDTVIAPDAPVKISATLKDDYGLTASRVLMATTADGPLSPVVSQNYPGGTISTDLSQAMDLPADVRKHGNSIRVQVEATDNRDLTAIARSPVGATPASPVSPIDTGGPQIGFSPVIEIKFRDPEIITKEQQESTDKLRQILMEMLKTQKDLHDRTIAYRLGQVDVIKKINAGQSDLRTTMQTTADTFAFDSSNKMVQRTLQVLALNPAKDAVDLSASLAAQPDAKIQRQLSDDLQTQQRRVISTLESLLAMLNASAEPATQPTTREGGQLVSKPDDFKKLDEKLKEYMKEQQRILDQTASLAKKPVDNFDDKDKKLMADLLQEQDKLDAFMKATVSDFSKLAEQDMANASMIKDAMAIYSETTMAKDALKQQAAEIAVPAEESGLEGAKELSSNIEKWLSNTPDRQQWTQEELPTKSDTPMPELPKELEDMVGQLMEQQEDLFDQMEDMNANITDSADKGIGWDAADGPIADMSAKGMTGNQLPNNNEMGGRSGEGRSGRSQGEFVGDNAVGKGGRNTPTRLDPTPFQQGQINDTSKDPVGGATGGGKMSGQGGEGLEGPVPPKIQEGLKRLATKQAELRNNAERLNLQYHLNRYDNFKMQDSIEMMRRVESDLDANRYQNALRRRDVLLDDLDTSHLLTSGQIHVQQDTTPTTSLKTEEGLNDTMKGELPPAWSDALKEYYKKLAAQ